MIIVFADLGGEKLLGRAREIADSLGDKVLAVCKDDAPLRSQRLISLGADEVVSIDAKTVDDWSKVLASLIRTENETRFVFLPSNLIGNAILGATYALAFERVGSVADGIEKLNEQGASKTLHSSESVIRFTSSVGKVSLWSIKLNSVPEPFEDPSRYGRTRKLELPKASQSPGSPSAEKILDISSRLTILVGKNYFEKVDVSGKKIEDLAQKFAGNVLRMSGKVQVVYGPCLAIEVESPEKELPEFQSELLSLNTSKDAAISRISNLSATTPDIGKVIDKLLESR